jgi:hypothetical protein
LDPQSGQRVARHYVSQARRGKRRASDESSAIARNSSLYFPNVLPAGTIFVLTTLKVFLAEGPVMPRRKWTQREYAAFKEWEKRFDRPLWWMLAVAICLPVFAIMLSAMTK